MANVRFLIWVVFLPQGTGSVSGFWCLFSVAEFDSYCPSNHNMYIKDDSSLPFPGVRCLDEELDHISIALRNYISMCVLARDLMEFQLSLTSVPGCNKRLCWLFWAILVLLVFFSKGGLASLPGLGWEDRRCPVFLLEKSSLSNTCSYDWPLHDLSKILQDILSLVSWTLWLFLSVESVKVTCDSQCW